MDKAFLDGMVKILESNKSQDIQEGFSKMVKAIEKQTIAFGTKKKHIQEDIKSGSRLTKHRLSL
ncbi:hypothetical protein [Methylomagnum ishizawai]|uniref:hypothetical protein n=1 Tax=Methylomagnum ishizawai TaxID=1760988 RepID=UPI000F748518|nr:hypothetical protein [Methylomagnum ishizawai]